MNRSTLTTSIHYLPGRACLRCRQEDRRKKDLSERRQFSFADDMISYVENPKESTKKHD